MKKADEIIEMYKENKQLYDALQKYYIENKKLINEEELTGKIKSIVASYYVYVYKFKTYMDDSTQDKLLNNISRLCNLSKKVKDNNGKIKIYPVKENDVRKEQIYKKVMKDMVDYQIENNVGIEEVFKIYSNEVGRQLNDFKQSLMQKDVELYYGSIYYMVEKTLFTINCIKNISNISSDLEKIENEMLQYEKKYIKSREEYEKDADFCDVDDEFYKDYDLIESDYKKILIIENELAPAVIEQWKKYLTNPQERNENYKYIMHCFTSGMVNPNSMNKACCSLYTSEIKNAMPGNSGLIYDIDAESLDTMCAGDAGSWSTNKKEFIEKECPCRWQVTKHEGNTVFYENPRNSKLITPEIFEAECNKKIEDGDFHYSEIYLNNKAKALGAFYTDKCQNIEEIKAYAKMNNLPTVEMKTSTKHI